MNKDFWGHPATTPNWKSHYICPKSLLMHILTHKPIHPCIHTYMHMYRKKYYNLTLYRPVNTFSSFVFFCFLICNKKKGLVAVVVVHQSWTRPIWIKTLERAQLQLRTENPPFSIKSHYICTKSLLMYSDFTIVWKVFFSRSNMFVCCGLNEVFHTGGKNVCRVALSLSVILFYFIFLHRKKAVWLLSINLPNSVSPV